MTTLSRAIAANAAKVEKAKPKPLGSMFWGTLTLTLDQALAVHRVIGLRLDDERMQGRRPDEESSLREVLLQMERIRFDHESRTPRP